MNKQIGKETQSQSKRTFWRRHRNSNNNNKSHNNIKGVVTKSTLLGGKFTPPTDPPDQTGQPWYPVTLVWLTKPGDVTFTDVVRIFRSQVDPQSSGLNQNSFDSNKGGSFRFQFRAQRIAVWNLSGRSLGLSVTDDLDADTTDKDQLGSWLDCGGPATFPRIGFVYPLAHRSRVHRPDASLKNVELFRTVGGSQDSVLIHFSILWKFDGPSKALVVDSIVHAINKGVRGVHTQAIDTNSRLAELSSKVDRLLDAQPSTGQKFIDGAVRVASYVIPAVIASPEASDLNKSISLLSLSSSARRASL